MREKETRAGQMRGQAENRDRVPTPRFELGRAVGAPGAPRALRKTDQASHCEHLNPEVEMEVWVPGYCESVEEARIPRSVLKYAEGILRDFRTEHPDLVVERIEVSLGVGRWRIHTENGPEVEGP